MVRSVFVFCAALLACLTRAQDPGVAAMSEIRKTCRGCDKGKSQGADVAEFEDTERSSGDYKYLNCALYVRNKNNPDTSDFVEFTVYGEKQYKDSKDFEKDQSEIPCMIEEMLQRCKTEGIGKIDSRVCNSVNTASFRGLSKFHYFNYPGFETYVGQWSCFLSDKNNPCINDTWYSSEFDKCYETKGNCNQYNGTNKETCQTSKDKIRCRWKSSTGLCTTRSPCRQNFGIIRQETACEDDAVSTWNERNGVRKGRTPGNKGWRDY